MGAYFNDIFELNTAKHKASSVSDTAFGGRFDLIKPDQKFGYMHLAQ